MINNGIAFGVGVTAGIIVVGAAAYYYHNKKKKTIINLLLNMVISFHSNLLSVLVK